MERRDRPPRRHRPLLPVLIALGVALLGPPSLPAADTHQHTWASGSAAPARPGWVSVGYGELIDPEAIIRTGQRLREALAGSYPRGTVQPFLDPYSSLLPYAVTMVYGPDPEPQRSVVERYPPGSAQPAWAAILRGGRIHATADGKGRARLFLPGDDPRAAYRDSYPVVRHVLASLLPPDGSPLEVEVFAYTNDYRKSELGLNLKPFAFRRTSFPPDRAPLDLAGLDEFFHAGGRVEGAELSGDEGLVLFASEAAGQNLAGRPASLSDLAVAYRAVFHAGENEAFISLDAHRDPMQSTVNFGGFLEDTRLGAVVLAADKRFKTVNSGLDPDTFQDVREEVRRRVPSFLTSAERGFLDSSTTPTNVWEGVRFWFYPDSVGVESDPEHHWAVVTRAQFTADAERLGEGWGTAPAARKKAAVSIDVRESIRQLNQRYEQYAAAFPELGELAVVGRLMAVCIWLRKTDHAWIDLDALLGVELPPMSTPRELTKMIATSYVTAPPTEKLREEYVRKNARVFYLTPTLDRRVDEAFQDSREMAEFLAFKKGRDAGEWELFRDEGADLLAQSRGKRVRDLLKNGDDLVAILKYAARRLDYPMPPGVGDDPARLQADWERIKALQARKDELKAKRSAAGGNEADHDEAELAGLENELQGILKRHHDQANLKSYRIKSVVEITGGINLRPDSFSIKKTASSPALDRFRDLAGKTGTSWKAIAGKEKWIRSRATSTRGGARVAAAAPPPATAKPGKPAAKGKPAVIAKPAAKPAAAPKTTPDSGPGEERPVRERPPEPALRNLQVAAQAGVTGAIRGEVTADGRIVFKPVSP